MMATPPRAGCIEVVGQADSGASLFSVDAYPAEAQRFLDFHSEFLRVPVSQRQMIFFLVNRVPESRPKLPVNIPRRLESFVPISFSLILPVFSAPQRLRARLFS
jgi:hypothetical protein